MDRIADRSTGVTMVFQAVLQDSRQDISNNGQNNRDAGFYYIPSIQFLHAYLSTLSYYPWKGDTGTIKTLIRKDPFMPPDPISHLRALIEKYTVISFIPDINRYRSLSGQKNGTCIFRGCTEAIAWEDARGGNFLCQGHYIIMNRWIEEARKGLISGDLSAVFDVKTPPE